jgi:4-amino-4-deoxy-L-arabinose transferase-like glycosyltransferase
MNVVATMSGHLFTLRRQALLAVRTMLRDTLPKPAHFRPGRSGPLHPTVAPQAAPAGAIGELPRSVGAESTGLIRAALLLVVLGAAALRVYAVGLGHPFLSFQPDEDANALRSLRLAHGELNPLYYYYPTLWWYLLAAVYRFVFWCGRELGLLSTWDDFTRFYANDPVLFYLGRVLAVVFGTATVACLYLLGQRAFSQTHGILAASFLTVAFLHVRDSALSTTEAPLTFFVVLTLIGAVRVYQDGGLQDYALAGLAGGLATATKYNAVLAFVAVAVAHVLRRVEDGAPVLRAWCDHRLLAAGLLGSLVFIALNPYLLVDWPHAWGKSSDWGSLAWEWQYVHTVEYLDLRPVWWYHLSVSLRYGMGLALLALALTGMLLTLWRRNGTGLVLLSFSLAFFAGMANLQAVFVRYMTPLVPVLCLFAAAAVQGVAQALRWPRLRPWIMAGLTLLALLEPLQASVAYGRITHHRDTRIAALEYVREALPPGSVVATYGPSVTWRSTIPRWWPQMYAKDPLQSWQDVFEVLKSRDTRYLLVHRSALDVFSPAIPELDRAIRESATLIREFRPYKLGTHPAPLFDRNDAYFFPIGGFRGVVRPGPLVQLYRLE